MLKKRLLMLYTSLGAFEAGWVIASLLLIPPDPKNAFLFGYSMPRLVLIGTASIFFIPMLVSLIRFLFWKRALDDALLWVDEKLAHRYVFFVVTSISVLIFVLGGLFLLYPFGVQTKYASLAERAAPIVELAFLLGVQALLGLFFWRGRKLDLRFLHEHRRLFVLSSITLGLILVVAAWVFLSRVGLTPQKYGWHSPGTPVLFVQVLFAWGLGLPFLFWGDRIETFVKKLGAKMGGTIRLDVLLCLLIWAAAVLIWSHEPMRSNSYFNPEATPPNFEYYPYSDAFQYDRMAQNIVIGAPENNPFVLRPLYVFFLVFLHTAAGQVYEPMLLMQILVLALAPVTAYLFASLFGGQTAGIMLATLLILRERNSIALTNIIEVSHVKLLLADMPMMFMLLLAVLLFVNWLRAPNRPGYFGVLAGAGLGLAILIRSQALLLIPVFVLGIFFMDYSRFAIFIRKSLLFGLGLAIVVAPWIWRNHDMTGRWSVENSEFYITSLASGYASAEELEIRPNETEDDYYARIQSVMLQYVLKHPDELARAYSSYFVHNEIISLLYLPMSVKLYGLETYVKTFHLWGTPVFNLGIGSGILFLLTLVLIALGIGQTSRKFGWLGVMPLLIHLTYNFSVVIGRISGWRFMLPVDWILLFYYSIGLTVVTAMLLSAFGGVKKQDENPQPMETSKPSRWISVIASFFVLGLSLPLTERLVPRFYPPMTEQALIETHAPQGLHLTSGEILTTKDLQAFIQSENSVILYGRGLYPSYYQRDDQWGDNNEYLLRTREFERLQFSYIGSENASAFLVLDEPPPYFPHASDVLIIGCRETAGIRVLAVRVNDQPEVISESPWQGLRCVTSPTP